MILIPTRGRPQNIKRLIQAYNATKASEPVVLLLDADDPTLGDYWQVLNEFCNPNWNMFISENERRGIPTLLNEYFSKYPNEEYYGILCDDVVPRTDGWDVELKEECLDSYIAWGNDLHEGAVLATHPFISGELCRYIGFVAYPKCFHGYVDLLWTLAGYMLNSGEGYLDHIILEHDQKEPKQYDKVKDRQAYIDVLPSYIETIKHFKIKKSKV